MWRLMVGATHTQEVVGNSISQQSEPVQWAAYKSGGVNSQPLGSSAPIVLDSLYKEIQRMQENEFHGMHDWVYVLM